MSSRESMSVPSRSNTTAWMLLSATGVAPSCSPDEERSHLHDELRGLTRSAHGLDHVRQRMQLTADQADHELVVVGVQAMAREPNVVGQIRFAIRLADGGVLLQNRDLFRTLELLESASAPERIPDGPGP